MFYILPNTIRIINSRNMGCRECSMYGNAYKILVDKAERKRPIGRSRYRWKGININFEGLGWEGTEWINLPNKWYQW
jgi:hypothetical protein